MKAIFLYAALLCSSFSYAQTEAKEVKHKAPLFPLKNEIGLVAETNFDNNSRSDPGFIGLQYKHWSRPNMGYRIIGGYGQFFEQYASVANLRQHDTIIEISREATIPVFTLGAGIEMQRKFYKRVHLFAAVEIRASYGNGGYNYVTNQRIENDPFKQYSFTAFSNQYDASLFSVCVAPSIGAKIQFNRICFGTELSAVRAGFRSLQYELSPSASESVTEFNAGVFRQRFFVNFRF